MPGEYSSPTLTGESQRPDTWREATLISIAEVRFSSVDKITHPSEESVRLCNYIDVYDNDYITSHLEFMRASATRPEIAKFRLQVGDVIITKDSETPDDIGIPAIVDYAAPDLVCGYHLGLIRPNHDEVDSTFLAKQLSHHRIARYFGTQANGLTRYGLPIGAVNNTPLWLPEHNEQKAIGLVLRLVDEAIAKTEAVITKLKQVRAGILHDLLTRGLDEHGQLRDPITHPEQFQDSPLGSIPCQWEVRPLRECLLRSPQNGIYKPAGAIGQGTILIGQTSITEDRSIDLALARRAEISPEERDRYGLREGDILMSRVFATLEGIGQPAFVPSLPEPAVFESNMMCLRVNPGIIASSLLFHWLMSARLRHKVVSCVNLSNQASINQQCLNSLPVAIPATPEQQRILNAIRIQYQSVQAESIQLRKLQQLKSGLMADFLTGRVRVPEEIVVAP